MRALADFAANGRWSFSSDCRKVFTALTGQTRISPAGGDGQEIVAPLPADGALPYPLEVAVTNGSRSLPGGRRSHRCCEGAAPYASRTPGGAGVVSTQFSDIQVRSSWRQRMFPSGSLNQAAFSDPSTHTCSTVLRPGRS